VSAGDTFSRFRDALRKVEEAGIADAEDALFDEVMILGLVSVVESLHTLAQAKSSAAPDPKRVSW
jgi:hypothetical protein